MGGKGRRNRKAIRIPGYDYGSPGPYFVTICTSRRSHLFGEVADGRVSLSPLGEIANALLLVVPIHSSGTEMVSHVVMPNHVHAILVFSERARSCVQLNAPTALPDGKPSSRQAEISPPGDSLAVVVRTYKAAVTTQARSRGFSGPIWQRGYYERVIRDEEELDRMMVYVEENPLRWDLDKENAGRNPPHSSR